MTITAAASPDAHDDREYEIPMWRLHLLRAMFLVWAVAGCFLVLPELVDPDPTARGMLSSMLSGLWLTSFFGLRYPLRMLPIFLLEFMWKTIWLITYGLPQWMAGRVDQQLGEDLLAIGLGPLTFGLIIPWSYVWRHYFKEPSERWR